MRQFFSQISKSVFVLIMILLYQAPSFAENSLPDLVNNQDERSLSNPSYVLGQYWFRKLNGSTGLIEFPPAYNYLQQALSQIVPSTDLYNKTIDIALLNSSQTNAFVIPGNHLFIYSDILRIIQDETSFLALLGHEIAHLELNHYERSLELQKNETSKTLMLLLAGVAAASAGNGEATSALWLGGIANQQENLLKYSRSQEQEADRRGRELLIDSGLPVSGMNTLLTALFKQSMGANRIEFLSTHPLPKTRISDAFTIDQPKSVVFEPSSDHFLYFRATLLAYRSVIEGNQYRSFLNQHISDEQQRIYAYALAELLTQHTNKATTTLTDLDRKLTNQFIEYLRSIVAIAHNDHAKAAKIIESRLTLAPNDLAFRYLESQSGARFSFLKSAQDALGYEKRMVYRNNIATARRQGNLASALYYKGQLEFARGNEHIAMNLINRAIRMTADKHETQFLRTKEEFSSIISAERNQNLN